MHGQPQQEAAESLSSSCPLIAIAVLSSTCCSSVRMKRQEQERQALASNLKKNDEVLTNAGIYGTVVDVSENEDEITVKVDDNVRVKMTKSEHPPQPDQRRGGQAGQGRQGSQGVIRRESAAYQRGSEACPRWRCGLAK